MEQNDLAALTARVRLGDAAAAAEFVRLFEPQIRRGIRIHGTGLRLQRILDSEDLCQSVMRRFLGQLDNPAVPTDDPTRLLAWLLEVARNRKLEALRRERTAKRGGGWRDVGVELLAEQADQDAPVGLELEQRELLEKLFTRLSERGRRIAQLRADDVPWEDIARQLGGTPEAIRKSYRRAVSEAMIALEAEQGRG